MHNDDTSVLITSAATPYEDQLAARKKRYALLMGSRIVLLVLSAAAYNLSPWLAVALIALSVPLPWMAVLIANDAPARRSENPHRLRPDTPALTSGSTGRRALPRVVEGSAR